MSDFAQAGLICTLQQLNDSHLPRIEEELVELAKARPITLVLPCHADDLAAPALEHIVRELKGAAFLREIIVSVNGGATTGAHHLPALFATLPQPLRILWNVEAPGAGGKGLNVWRAFQLICDEARSDLIVTQDCDVVSFRRGTLARLCFACAHPQLDFQFAKMYYSRATDRLYGRVSRLFVTPLLHALTRVAGHLPLVDFLLSFRYSLAGECALTRELAAELPLSSGWGLEIATLCEVFRRLDPRRVCQVDGGSGYDHRHQPGATSLAAMSGEIARTLFAQLATEGIGSEPAWRETLVAAYRREAALAISRSANLALINGLPFDAAAENEMIEAFSAALAQAGATTPESAAELRMDAAVHAS